MEMMPDNEVAASGGENSETQPVTEDSKSDSDDKDHEKRVLGPSKEDFMAFKKPMLVPESRPKLVKNVFEEPKAPVPKMKKPPPEIKKESEKEPETTEAPKKRPELSPAQIQKLKEEALPYKEPSWGTVPEDNTFAFEILKGGQIIGKIELQKKSFYSLGRLPSCDVQIEHPSSSRYHAVIQYCGQKTSEVEQGWYIYDLDSTHGTWVNKKKLQARTYERIRVGHVAKFGGSTRLYILTGPESDQEEEKPSRMNKEQLELHERKAEVLRKAEEETRAEGERILSESSSCSWGMDFTESTEDQEENVDEIELSEETYIDDPKKALKSYFEREGLDPPEYEFLEAGFGKHHCRVQLPIDDVDGKPVYAECIMTGKKKEVVIACALEACRTLDRMGELRKSAQESRKREKRKWEENDFYDSDEDTFLDRTGVIEKKRLTRMKKAGKVGTETLTYDSIQEKLQILEKEKSEIDAKIEEDDKIAKNSQSDELDALDSYMLSIKSGKLDPIARRKLKTRLHDIRLEMAKLQKLAGIAKPAL